jgi:steroid delta-isomerase-like uncharacterized protein
VRPDERVRTFFEQVWNAHDFARFPEFVSPDVVYHPPRGPAKGLDGYRAMAEGFVRSFPDLHFAFEAAAVEGDVVATRIRITGTHGGTWRGLTSTGKRIDVAGRPWLRVRDGKVAEVWALWDEAGALEQLGALG